MPRPCTARRPPVRRAYYALVKSAARLGISGALGLNFFYEPFDASGLDASAATARPACGTPTLFRSPRPPSLCTLFYLSSSGSMLYNRILITGANGLLGQALVARMSRFPEYDVLATGRDDAPRYEGGSCGYAPLDITDPEAVHSIFQDFAPNVVINCAAMTEVDRCEANKEACWAVNVRAVETLAEACKALGARLIQVSTDFVFDGEDGPYREDARPDPVNYYGRSKLAAENVAREAGMSKWAIVRTVLVYGTGHHLSRSNIALWLIEQLANGESVHIVTDQWRTPTYVDDLATGIERLVHFEKTGVYHLSGRELLTVHDFAQTIADVFGFDDSLIHPVTSDYFDGAAPRPARTGFIILKAETELDYKPRPLREALVHLGNKLDLPVTSP